MTGASSPQKDSSTRPYTEMELFVREQRPGDHDFKIAYRMGPSASAGVAVVYGSNVGISPEVARALAYLMAAAPALVKALEQLLDAAITGTIPDDWASIEARAQAAIARAKGQQS